MYIRVIVISWGHLNFLDIFATILGVTDFMFIFCQKSNLISTHQRSNSDYSMTEIMLILIQEESENG